MNEEDSHQPTTSPVPPPTTLGAFLRQARQSHGLSIRQLEAVSGIPRNTIARLETDEVDQPSPENLVSLARALELKASDLFLLAGIPMPEGVPSLDVMLRTEYDLPEAGIREAEASIREIVARYRRDGGPEGMAGRPSGSAASRREEQVGRPSNPVEGRTQKQAGGANYFNSQDAGSGSSADATLSHAERS